jgi:hypothetical protein
LTRRFVLSDSKSVIKRQKMNYRQIIVLVNMVRSVGKNSTLTKPPKSTTMIYEENEEFGN